MIPFAPTLACYASELKGTGGFRTLGAKDMARCVIAGGQRLTVPVEGGARSLGRSHNPVISQHGRWQEVHLGAWRAVYGRMPWFPHLFPEMERIYREDTHGCIECFTLRLHELAMKWIGDGEIRRQAAVFRQENPERFRAIAYELAKNIDPGLSIFDTLFRLGRDTLFILI